MVQQRRGLLRVWNLSLVIATFSLTILGTFLTRSGVIQSVHTFSDSTIGPLLIGFFALVLVVGVGLIAWRGDRLRSPGGIDAPLSREGAFLGNNVLFVAFAFVVLLGTVFPLLYQALNNTQVTVGAPYFNALAVPLGLALLFLMGIAPALPWRKTTMAVMRGRIAVPAALAVVTVVACVIGGVHGLEPLVAFGLGAFAAASAGRALFLSVRLAWRGAITAGASPARAVLAGWRGFVGRANGGMVVHLGVVVIAVGLAAATSFGQRGEVRLSPGQTATFDGHTVEFVGYRTVRTPASTAQQAVMRVDGGGDFRPALTSFGSNSSNVVGTPSIDSGWRDDVYLTIDKIPSGSSVVIGVVVQPLVSWMWVGGALLVVGTLLSAIPGRRRRPTDPVSKPVAGVAGTPGPSDESGPSDEDRDGDDRLEEQAEPEPQTEHVPVGIGDRP
jgi:cytochrome c-type biogenesis protein CcmF